MSTKTWNEMSDDEIIAVWRAYDRSESDAWVDNGFTDVSYQATYMTEAEFAEAWPGQDQARWVRIEDAIADELHEGR